MTSPGVLGPTCERLELAAVVRVYRGDGLTHREIAEQLGISRSYAASLDTDPDGSQARARKDRYRGVCETCGGPTSGSDGRAHAPKLCASCAAERDRARKVWTREAVVDAIQRFAAAHGRPPTATEWICANPENRYPPRSAVYCNSGCKSAPFAKWADAIEAAGFPRPLVGKHQRSAETRSLISAVHLLWTRERVVAAIRAFIAAHGYVPKMTTRTNDGLPSAATIWHRGWRWADLVKEAGAHSLRDGWTRDEIAAAIRAWHDEHGAPPRVADWPASTLTHPGCGIVVRLFGRWNDAIDAAGLTPRRARDKAAA